MKLDARRVPAFLNDPADCRVVLLYGEDAGLIRERAERLVRACGAHDDPFRLADLERDGFSRIAEEMAALALTGGRRVVRVRDAGDAATTAVESVLASEGDSLLVLEAPGLPARSRLRALVERAARVAAIGCYPAEGRGLRQTIRETLAARDVAVDAEALEWLASQLGADSAATRSELEKLAIHAGPGGRADLAAAMASVGDLAGLSLDDALFAATAGDVATADRALECALDEGATPVGVLRAALQHLQRLQRARAGMDHQRVPAAEAAKAARPPVFFRRLPAFTLALDLWPAAALAEACRAIWEAESACKRTGAPAELLCRHAILDLARLAAARRRQRVA
jgi:DNA polymerase III subunit delta